MRALSDIGHGGLNGLFSLPIHFRVFLGLVDDLMGISPRGGPLGKLSPLTNLKVTLF